MTNTMVMEKQDAATAREVAGGIEALTLSVYGCRGSSPYDSPANQEFGGNTTCFGIRANDEMLIIDAGTGLLALQDEIFRSRPKNVYLLITHTHHDHIEGLGVTALPFIPGMGIRLFGKRGVIEGLEQRFNGYNFPVAFNEKELPGIDFKATKIFEDGERMELGDIAVRASQGNHPNGDTMAYRLERNGSSIVVATDFEFDYAAVEMDGKRNVPMQLDDIYRRKYVEFIRNAGLLVADGQYTAKEYLEEKPINVKGWGHSYAEQIIDMAAEAGVKKVLITHHSPKRTDSALLLMEESARKYCNNKGYSVEVEFARQGRSYGA